jgi:hypothetical protein
VGGAIRNELALDLSRREFMRGASTMGLGALVLSALPVAELIAPDPARAAVGLDDATLQAFADTIIPGRKATKTDLGDEIHPMAIAGVDAEPGAVEADVLRLYHSPLIGFDALAPAFLTDLNTRALAQGGPFLSLAYEKRVATLVPALAYENPERVLFEAAAAVPFTAFCAAAVHPVGTSANASGYRVMGYPGAAPNGYQRTFSYRRRLARERTKKGYLP